MLGSLAMDQDPKIKVRRNGPYLVTGGPPLTVKRPVESENGEPLTWKTRELEGESRSTYALCRCGQSGDKPFCDGTHSTVDFDGTETAPTEPYDERSTSYPGTGIEVFDDREICVHAGFCGNQVSNVWKMVDSTDDTVVRSQMIAMIERCPSGALSYAIAGDVIEPDLPLEVAIVPDGPLWLSGGIPVTRSDGEEVEIRNRITLCRCGASSNKPYCDGSHAEVGFSHDPTVPDGDS